MKRLISVILLVMLVTASFGFARADVVFAFENASYSVMVKKSLTLKPILQGATMPDKASYRWTTSDKAIAKVEKGKVTGVKAGEATITCEAVQGDEVLYETSCTVKVTQPVTKIKPEAETVRVFVEGSYKLQPTILPEDADNKELIYTSSNESIARVGKDGTILPVDVNGGKCTITMEAADGSGVKAKQTIAVVPFIVTTKEITLDSPKAYKVSVSYADFSFWSIRVKRDKQYLKLDGVYEGTDTEWYFTGEKNNRGYFMMYPLKAGTTTLTFHTHPYAWPAASSAKTSVKVKILPEAVIGKKTYPALDWDALSTPEIIGQPIHLVGKYAGIDLPSFYYHYQFTTADDDQRAFTVQVLDDFDRVKYADGEKVTIYGRVTDVVETKTETGLTIYRPIITADKMGDDFFLTEEVYLDFSARE